MATLNLHDIPDAVLTGQAASAPDTEGWLQEVEVLRSQLKGGPIPVDELVAATERDYQLCSMACLAGRGRAGSRLRSSP